MTTVIFYDHYIASGDNPTTEVLKREIESSGHEVRFANCLCNLVNDDPRPTEGIAIIHALREDQGKECYQKIKTQVEQMPKVTFYVIDSCRRHLVDGLAGLPNVRFMSGRNIFEFFEDLDSRQ